MWHLRRGTRLSVSQRSILLVNDTVRNTWERPIESPERLPERPDVVIIGGGIVGVSTAWMLARQGVSVALCEKGHIAGEQSGRNWGWVRKQGRDLRELAIMIESLGIWRDLAADIGEDVGFAEGGCLFAAKDEKELAGFEAWLGTAKEYGLDTRLLSAREIRDLVPDAAANWAGGLLTPSDGRAEPHKAAPAIARAAARAGADILTGCAVRGLDIEAGRVAGVVTEHGRIRADRVLCAGGAWAATFCRSLGVPLPQLRVRGTVARTAPAAGRFDGNVFDARIGIRKRDDGGYTIAPGEILDHPVTPSSFRWFFKFLPAVLEERDIVKLSFGKPFFEELLAPRRWSLDAVSPFEETRVLNPAPGKRSLKALKRDLAAVFPALADVEFVEAWAGMIESTPDVVPVIDAIADYPGFFVATGFSGHGFGIGPGAGRAIAGMLTEQDAGFDLEPLRYARFFDGSRMQLNATI